MLVRLVDADLASCGGKAGTLGRLVRAGLPVPDGFVVLDGDDDVAGLEAALDELGAGSFAVRSSSADEDMADRSAAGQYESLLGVRGADVAAAVRTCRASSWSPRAVAYRTATAPDGPGPRMAVLVQRMIDADVAGVMVDDPDGTWIEASWGLGPSVVGGSVTPDRYRVTRDGTVTRTLGDKATRVDRRGAGVATSAVAEVDRRRPALDAAAVDRLVTLARRVAALLGAGQDVEWAIAGDELWLLQARPVTAAVPAPPGPESAGTFTGTPGSRGVATGPVRTVLGPADFARVRAGDVLVCRWTDPAWTPLLGTVAAVVTETGGILAHAAIVARERDIPAVVGLPGATAALVEGSLVTVDGTAGTVTISEAG